MLRLAARVVFGIGAAAFAFLAYVYLTLPDVRPLAYENPTTTAFMELRRAEAGRDGRRLPHAHRWVPYGRISQHLKRAVLVAEDSAFWEHEGVDVEQIRASMQINIEQGRAVRGASTITQQLAKNLYLSPSRDPVRKFRELVIARRMEAALPKARILELYLNVIEWGDGIWGAEAAARAYFRASASSLTREQAALLAAAIINPRALSPARPSRRLLSRQRLILRRMGAVEPPAAVPVSAPVEPAPEAPLPIEAEPEQQLPPGEPLPETPLPSEPLPPPDEPPPPPPDDPPLPVPPTPVPPAPVPPPPRPPPH